MKAASAHTPLFSVAEVETSTANGLQTKVYMHSYILITDSAKRKS